MDCKVKYFDYPLQFKAYESEYMSIIKDTLSRGAYILGKDLEIFEENLARFCNSRFAIGVASCTDALLLAVYAANIKEGDEVISVSHTFVATIETIKVLGARPIFVDIGEDHNMDIGLVESAITSKTKAIMPVHLNGTICKGMDELVKIARRYKLLIIEDAAQSLGAKYNGRCAGTFGLAGCFSFYPAKALGAFGDAGAIITDNAEFADKVKLMRNHGRDDAEIKFWGLNCRMDNLHAGILDFKLKKLPEWIKRRRQIAGIYNSLLSDIKQLKLPRILKEADNSYNVFQNYEIEAEDRDNLRAYLAEKGIETILPWTGKAVHQFKALGFTDIRLPKTERLFEKVLMIPMYPELKNDQVEYVAKSVKNFYDK